MKRIKVLLFALLLFMPCVVFAAGSVTVNKSSITIEQGDSATFTVTANNAAGKVTFASNNSGVASINKSSEWVENGSTTVTVSGKSIGSTSITVSVDAASFDEEPIKTSYIVNVTVTKPKSSNNNLSSLTVDGSTVSGFSAGKTSYNLGTTKANSISIGASVADGTASVSGTVNKSLRYGSNTFNVVVTAENGSKKTYSVTITKQDDRNSDNTLKILSIDAGSIDFNSNTTNYSIKVKHDVSTINIKAEANNSKASVSGTGEKELKDYSNDFSVVVTAENQTKRTYTIRVIRADESGNYGKLSTVNDLKSLSIEGYEISFNKEKLEYEILIGEDVESLNINAVSADETALINISGNEGLKPGENKVEVVVTAENGDIKTYVIDVYKKGTITDNATIEKTYKKTKNIWKIIAIISLVVNGLLIVLLVLKIIPKKKKTTKKAKKNEK